MITPKQITRSQAGHDRRRNRRSRANKTAKRLREQEQQSKSATVRDPLFDALRDELGL